MSRILFMGDLAATGFGTVTMDLGRELLNLGHDLRFVSQNEVHDLPEPFDSRTLRIDPSMVMAELAESHDGQKGLGNVSLAMISDGYGSLFNGRLFDGWVPDVCIIIGDFGNVRLMVMRDEQTRAAFASVPVLHYVPIEGKDIPPTLREMWSVVRPVAMCEDGADEIERVTGTRPPMVYHGVDTDQFRPLTPEKPLYTARGTVRSKEQAKKMMGCDPRARLIVRADRNVTRKRYASLLRSMAPVLWSRPDTYLVIHAFLMDLGGDLHDLRSKLPARIQHQVIVTDGRVSRDDLTVLYNAADLYVSVSAEGFGLTIAEAMACGTPAVGIDYSAVPEVIGPGGRTVPIAGLVDNEYGYYWAGVNEPEMAKVVGELIDDPAELKRLGRIARQHVVDSFQWTTAARQFSDLIPQSAEVAA